MPKFIKVPANKSANLRYKVIDRCLTNSLHRYPTKEYIIEKIEEQIGRQLSDSMFNKDLDAMRNDLDAPIKYCRINRGYYYTEPGFFNYEISFNP